MAKRKRIGRPPLPASRKRRMGVLLKLLPEERRAYHAAAERAGLPLAVWVRGVLDSAAGRKPG